MGAWLLCSVAAMLILDVAHGIWMRKERRAWIASNEEVIASMQRQFDQGEELKALLVARGLSLPTAVQGDN
jgi:hypothetical protein